MHPTWGSSARRRPRGRREAREGRRYTPRGVRVRRVTTARRGRRPVRAARVRIRSTGPGSTRASCARSSPTPCRRRRAPAPREWVIGVVSAGGRRSRPRSWCSSPSARSGDGTARRSRRRSFTGANAAVDYGVADRVVPASCPSVVTVRATSPAGTTVGSGVAVSSDRVLTSAHVVAGATTIVVDTRLRPRVSRPRSWAATPTPTWRCSTSPTPTSSSQPLGHGDAAEVGQPVVAVGADEGQPPCNASTSCPGCNVLVTHVDRRRRSPGCSRPGSTRTPETSGGGAVRHERRARRDPHQPARRQPRPASRCRSGSPTTCATSSRRAGRSPTGGSASPPTTPDGSTPAATVTAVAPGEPGGGRQARGRRRDHAGGRAVRGQLRRPRRRVAAHRPGDSLTIDYRRGRSNREASTTATLTAPPPATRPASPQPSPRRPRRPAELPGLAGARDDEGMTVTATPERGPARRPRPRAAQRGAVGLPAGAAAVRGAGRAPRAHEAGGARAGRAGQGARRAAPALGDLRHPGARLRLGARGRARSTPTASTRPPR